MIIIRVHVLIPIITFQHCCGNGDMLRDVRWLIASKAILMLDTIMCKLNSSLELKQYVYIILQCVCVTSRSSSDLSNVAKLEGGGIVNQWCKKRGRFVVSGFYEYAI